MLVLTRRVGERIAIDEHVEIIVVRIRGNKVQLGVVAPDQVAVRRREVGTNRKKWRCTDVFSDNN